MDGFYDANMKLADVISNNYKLLSILERLDINLGFGDSDIYDICKRYDLSLDLFLIICNVYSFDNYVPNVDLLSKNDIKKIISYLRKSHIFYINRWFPKLHESIHLMVEDYDKINKTILNKFYDDYDTEISKHFEYEEKIVFPYVEKIIDNIPLDNKDFNILKFQQKHTDIDEKLNDLKNIIIKYIPEKYSSSMRTDVLMQIFNIEDDLSKHTIIENKVLTPLVLKIENNE